MIDANVLIAALLRDSTTRSLIVLGGLDLHAPRYLFEEIESHWDEMLAKAGSPARRLQEALRILGAYIHLHELTEYASRIDEAMELMGATDPRDAPYVALALAIDADAIWSEDRGLSSSERFKILRTSDVVKVLRTAGQD